MKKDLLHTPEGVRDIYSTECVEKKIIENKLHDVCRLYGYNDIQTPSIEYFDVFSKRNEAVCLLMKCSSYSTDMAILLC